jgi:hypothetical protein
MNSTTPVASQQPWIYSRLFDLTFITGPAIFSSVALLVFCSPNAEAARGELPLGAWLLCIVGIDVAHVWSTLFRTYLDPLERKRYRVHLILVPIACWLIGVLLYSASPAVFWSGFAYLAAFHFIRQQYGFYALYARYERTSRTLDTATVYIAAIYPLLYWHSHPPREFVWFVEGDFFLTLPPWVSEATGYTLIVLLGLQGSKELYRLYTAGSFNLPKNLIIWGTALSWYVGIVHFNADIPFTVTNVVSHGIPYMALVWAFGAKKIRLQSATPILTTPQFWHRFFRPSYVGLFIAFVLCLAFLEESLWDALVWRERESAFGWAWSLPHLEDPRFLALIVPILSIPQAVHYVLDAFIWRIRKPSSETNHLLYL